MSELLQQKNEDELVLMKNIVFYCKENKQHVGQL